ncbi:MULTISPECIES: substrate-binding domain-containing protein [unclassified Kitasatospora]|uniref:GntR family transcriptional regulator n=1 Tax=unclassified Kitasatospora TaxID=2633591 RepID=UPI000710EBB4|nr:MULTISPECIES: substrate-binding domain-containing protein [unclassified Kitasatospora]KQV12405.1 GntR family transcriptional regulator [Kitasatospora sp. Root107]KRB66907.1 GntR family transcriptional regulator [Kitasatospora sp. Root187]
MSGEGPISSRELKFRALAADLRRNITDGTWPVGSKLPTDESLAAESGMSISTVRRAYDELVGAGLVERRQGAGTFVTTRVPPSPQRQIVVGVVVPTTTLYFPRVVRGIEATLGAARARTVLACSDYDLHTENAAIEELITGGVSGLLLVPSLHELADPIARGEELRRLPVPVVLVERRLAAAGPADTMEYVCTNHEAGAYEAVRHLHDLGHSRIGLLLRTDGPTAGAIVSGYEWARTAFGLPAVPRQEDRLAAWTSERADEALRAVRAAKATAVLCFGELEALTFLGATARAGLSVPGDLALVAYDNELGETAPVPLTSVSPPKFQIGQLAARVLLQRLRFGEAFPVHQIRLRPRLVVRASCGGRGGSADTDTPPVL